MLGGYRRSYALSETLLGHTKLADQGYAIELHDEQGKQFSSLCQLLGINIHRANLSQNSIITLLRDDALGPTLAFSNLLRRPWFRRMWIQQEVALAKDIWIYCGSQSTTWNAFSSVLKALKMKSKFSKDFRAAWNLATFRHQYQKNRESGGVDIHTAMVQARQCDATDMRDKVYALLGVCPELACFVGDPDYGLPVSIVWTRAQRAYLASHLSINALSLVSVGEQVREDLPSWVPDLSTGVRTWPRRPPSATPTDGLAKNPSML